MNNCNLILFVVFFLFGMSVSAQNNDTTIRIAPARCTGIQFMTVLQIRYWFGIKKEKNCWMFYSARRANIPTYDVSAYYETKIGTASSSDHGKY